MNGHCSRFALASLSRAVRLALIGTVLCLALPTNGNADFTNQNSRTTYYHSGIVTSTSVVWDTTFARMVDDAIDPGTFNEIAFGFMECFGGGMIDELLDRNLVFASYTSAARHDEQSWAGGRDPASGGVRESYYNLHYGPAAGGAVANTHSAAATTGRNNDLVGPVVMNPLREHPQYTSSGPIGDSITLHRNNPNNPINNTSYLAVVFGGSTNEVENTNSFNRITAALTARGYAAAEERLINPGGTAKDIADAWAWVQANTKPTTQIYYWNSWGHGTRAFDFIGYTIDQIGNQIQKATDYFFDLTAEFVDQVQERYNIIQMLGGSGLDGPYIDIQADALVSDMTLNLNGQALSPLSATDIYGDGSLYDYRFLLTGSDVFSLLTSGNSFSIDWVGDPGLGFEIGGISTGDLANAVPEPGTYVLLILGASGIGLVVTRKRLGVGRAAA